MDQRVFDEAVNETMDLLDLNYSEALKDTINQFQQMVSFNRVILTENKFNYFLRFQGMDLSGIKLKLESASDPLPSALYKLKTYFEIPTWDASQKEQIVQNLKIVDSECKTKEGRTLCKLSDAYNIICGYLERLTEFDADQKAQFIKSFDSLLGGNNKYAFVCLLNFIIFMHYG